RLQIEHLERLLARHSRRARRRLALASAPIGPRMVEPGFEKARARLVIGAQRAPQLEKFVAAELGKAPALERAAQHRALHPPGVVVEAHAKPLRLDFRA